MSGNGGNVQEAPDTRSRFPSVMPNLERELNRASAEQTPEVKRNTYATRPPLQTIADAIKRLVWDDNEKFAQMISAHYQAGGDTASMAAALQRAADDLLKEENGSRQ